ncbi:MAG: VOC family protein [Acidobacteriota bacterium]
MDLARVIIFTQDVGRLVNFYASHFGLELVGEADPGWTELNAGGCNLAFHKFSGSVEKGDKADNGIKFVFGTRDVAAERSRLQNLGVEMTKIFDFGDIRMCDGSDPDGNRFQISSRGL